MTASASSRCRAPVVVTLLVILLVVLAAGCSERIGILGASGEGPLRFDRRSRTITRLHPHRKLLHQASLGEAEIAVGGGGLGAELDEETNRMREGGECSKDDVVVYQAASSPLPNGIPTYSVQVVNTCLGTGCGDGVSSVHLSCGWFSSARLINPRVFRRLRFNDCLVNDGRFIPAGGAVAFQYANSYPYALAVSSVSCMPTRSP